MNWRDEVLSVVRTEYEGLKSAGVCARSLSPEDLRRGYELTDRMAEASAPNYATTHAQTRALS